MTHIIAITKYKIKTFDYPKYKSNNSYPEYNIFLKQNLNYYKNSLINISKSRYNKNDIF